MSQDNNLNIEINNFGNDNDYYFLDDPFMYLKFSPTGDLKLLGRMQAEKSLKVVQEFAMHKTGIPKTEQVRTLIDQEITLEGTVMQWQPEIVALISQRRFDDSDLTYRRVIFGASVPSIVTPSCVLAGETVSGKTLSIYIRKLRIATEEIDFLMGGDEHSGMAFKGVALVDEAPLTTNPTWPYNSNYATQDNIMFFAWLKSET
jgi:hypothetical protein